MWSDWLVSCVCGFQSVCPLMEKDKRLMEASWWERLTEGEIGSYSDGWGHGQWIFNPIFCGAVFSPCYLPGANYGGGNEENGDFLQKVPCMHSYTQCPQPCSHRHLDRNGQVWGSLLWDHCFFLLGPGVHEILFVPAKSLFRSPV